MARESEIARGHGRKGVGFTPHGIEALNKGKTKSSDMPPKKQNKSQGGAFWKEAKELGLRGARKDMSSGQSMPIKCYDDNRKRYNGVEQPIASSNADNPRPCKFVN